MSNENGDNEQLTDENLENEEEKISDEIKTEKKANTSSRIHGPSIVYGASITAVIVLVFAFGGDFIQPTEKEIIEEQIITQENNNELTLDTFFGNSSPLLGNPNAPIILVEFGDYQCHFCNVFYHNTEHEILENFVTTGKVNVIFKDYTIIGQDSVNAAHAAHCAGEQGKFWQYHNTLYDNWSGENNGWASNENLRKFAQQVELDMDTFTQCNIDGKYAQLISTSNNDAQKLGITGTPAFYVISSNTGEVQRIQGAQPYEVFEKIFNSMLEN